MKNQYHSELCALARSERALLRNHQRDQTACDRQIAALKRDLERGHRATQRELEIINKRAAVLKARLASTPTASKAQ